MSLAARQLAGVIRLELKKTFFTRRGWWVYFLALGPLGLNLIHTLGSLRRALFHGVTQDSFLFAGEFQTYFLHLGMFFGCVGIFANLFRGEMLEKTMHYYFLTPVRRELLVLGKYISGAAVAVVLFTTSAVLSFYLVGYHQGAAWSDFVLHGPGLRQMALYAVTAILACLGYGAVFLTAGLLFRNPMIAAAVVWVWENLNPFLPTFLKKISIIFYLKSLLPVQLPVPPGRGGNLFELLMTEADPTPAALAATGLVVVTALILTYAAISARRAEISYGE